MKEFLRSETLEYWLGEAQFVVSGYSVLAYLTWWYFMIDSACLSACVEIGMFFKKAAAGRGGECRKIAFWQCLIRLLLSLPQR